jgi:flagellar motor protein MotB
MFRIDDIDTDSTAITNISVLLDPEQMADHKFTKDDEALNIVKLTGRLVNNVTDDKVAEIFTKFAQKIEAQLKQQQPQAQPQPQPQPQPQTSQQQPQPQHSLQHQLNQQRATQRGNSQFFTQQNTNNNQNESSLPESLRDPATLYKVYQILGNFKIELRFRRLIHRMFSMVNMEDLVEEFDNRMEKKT